VIRLWDIWKKAFDAWEVATAPIIEQALKSRVVLEPTGALLTAALRAKAASDQAFCLCWRAVGVATRRDQERAMHALNQLQSRLMDVEEQLYDR
jgi:hypothetical protein